MSSLQLAKEDAVLNLVSHVFQQSGVEAATGAMSSMTPEDKSTITGTNTIATLLATSSDRIGTSDIEKAEVQQWLSFTARPSTGDADSLLKLNTYLARQTFLVGDDYTVADLAAYARLHATVAAWDTPTQSRYCHITRYFDHVQHLEPVESFAPLATVELAQTLDRSVEIAIEQGAPKEAIAKDATRQDPSAPAAGTPAAKDAAATTTPEQQKKDKRKDKKAKEQKPAAAPAAEQELSPALISFKVGHIQKCVRHSDADSLYVSTVDLGESEPRTVVSGLVKYVPLEDMQGRRVVCVCNLKPAAMRGVKSSAMVLAASPRMGEGEVKDTVELVKPPTSCKPGDVLTFEGFAGEPEQQLNPKKKVFEQVQVGLTTTDALEVVYNDIKEGSTKSGRLTSAEGQVCTVQSLVNATIR